jgi:hypothetical protein
MMHTVQWEQNYRLPLHPLHYILYPPPPDVPGYVGPNLLDSCRLSGDISHHGRPRMTPHQQTGGSLPAPAPPSSTPRGKGSSTISFRRPHPCPVRARLRHVPPSRCAAVAQVKHSPRLASRRDARGRPRCGPQ